MNTTQLSDSRGMVVDRESNTIRFERHVAANQSAVFEAWTKPEQVTQWWDPDGEPLESCEIDLRPGGAFRFVNRGGHSMPFAGVYREIVPPTGLVFDAMGAIGRVILNDADGETEM